MFGKQFTLDPKMGLLELIEKSMSGELKLPKTGRLGKTERDMDIYETSAQLQGLIRLFVALGKEHEQMHKQMDRENSDIRTFRHILIHGWASSLRDLIFAAMQEALPEADHQVSIISDKKFGAKPVPEPTMSEDDLPLGMQIMMAVMSGDGSVEITRRRHPDDHRCYEDCPRYPR